MCRWSEMVLTPLTQLPLLWCVASDAESDL